MTRDTLVQILGDAEFAKASKERFKIADDHRVIFYVGQPGQALVTGEVESCTLHDGFVELVARENGTHSFFTYEAVHGLSARKSDRRAGFA
jgi:hypothetical protein